jgi:hypothetical protein
MRILPLVFLVACGSTEAKTDGGNSESGGGGGDYTVSSLDQKCGNGPSGADLMRFVRASYSGTYTPPSARPASNPWKGSTSPSAVAIGVTHGAGAIVCHPPSDYYCPPGAPCRAPPPTYVTVALDMTVKTADKTLDEKVVITAQYDQTSSSVSFTGDLPVAMIGGTYPVSGGTKLTFSGTFSGASTNAGISELNAMMSFSGGQWMATEAVADAGADVGTD